MAALWILVFIFPILVTCNDIGPAVYEPEWAYKCLPFEGCHRSEKPMTGSVAGSMHWYSSLDVCRTVCGRFGGIWPKPKIAVLTSDTVKIHPNNLRFDLVDVPVEVRRFLASMTQVVGANLMDECHGNVTETVDTPVVVYISVKSNSMDLTWDTDESYILNVKTNDGRVAVHVGAETVYGARHAMETLSQLVAAEAPEHTDQYKCSLRLISGANINDAPVYKHRGLMLDTSRNFIPLENIKRTIDAMAATKMNVFHWHVTDSHSFPLQSARVPQFTKFGAYSSFDIYSSEDVRDLIEYARLRGVRVVIELDSPAHAGNGWQWGKEYGYGDLAVCVNAEQWRNLCIQPPCGQLNPANSYMYQVLKNLYMDIAEALPKPALLHMGGDEVFFPCWNSSKEIVDYMKENGLETTADGFIELWAEFHRKALAAWDEQLAAVGTAEQPVMLWSSALTKSPRIQEYLDKKRYIIEVWEPVNSYHLRSLLDLGYRTVSVPKNIWYLDHGFWGNTKYSNWRQMYAHTLENHKNLLGGEVAMWTELVDPQGLDPRIWPRAASVAERLWSNPTSTANAAESRLQRLRSRLVARGLRPDVLSPEWCAQHGGKCL